jgi:hypothetical protein
LNHEGRERKDILLTKQGLLRYKSRARKNGAWFEILSRIERAIVDLTIKCVETVRSPMLAKTINGIIDKLARTLQKTFIEKAHEIGAELSKRIVEIAQEWGNTKSPEWETDDNFIKFLGITELNT